MAQRPARPQRPHPIVGIADADAVPRSVADDGLNLRSEVTGAEDHIGQTVPPEQLELMVDERLARHADQGLGDAVGEGAQSPCAAAREDGDGQRHENSTFVPSKSKRKRTSCSPAFCIAARRGSCCSCNLHYGPAAARNVSSTPQS